MTYFHGEEEHIIRPYILTGGRTTARVPIEAIVVTRIGADRFMHQLNAEQQHIVKLCELPQAVAEIAAKVSIPLGVARILVSDLAAMELLLIPQTTSASADVSLVERLINGIRRR